MLVVYIEFSPNFHSSRRRLGRIRRLLSLGIVDVREFGRRTAKKLKGPQGAQNNECPEHGKSILNK
jgi:hypothetical protein